MYIKACSGLLEIDEAVLMETANKALKKNLSQKWADQKREIARKERAQQQGQDEPLPEAFDPSYQANEELAPQNKPKTQSDYYKERDILKLLLNYGDKIIPDTEGENLAFAPVLIANLEDVIDHFKNPTYRSMIELAREKINAGDTIHAKYFINHPEKEIRTMAVTLCSEEFTYSHNWEDMHDMTLRTQPFPDENFFNEGMQALKYFKLTKIKEMMAENKEKMKDKDANITLLIKTHQRLLEIRNGLAKELRIVLMH